MLRTKKFLVLLLFVFLLVLSACSSGTTTPPSDSSSSGSGGSNTDSKTDDGANANKNVEITFWTLSLSPTFDDYINGVIKAFEEQNPGVKVNWEDVPFDQAEQRTLTAAAGGQLADVINLNTDFLKKLAALGALVNMDEAAADVKADYFPGVWKAGEVKGAAYALPWYLSNSGLLYNKELLAKAGFDNPPKNEEEAWEMSKVLVEQFGVYGSTVRDIHLYLPSNGIPLVNADGTQAAFNTSETLEIFNAFKQRYDDGLIPEEVLLGQVNIPEWYAQEKVAWWGTGPQLYRQVKDLSPEVYEKSDAAPAILGSIGKSHVAIMNIAVFSKSKNQDAAVAFAKFMTNAENQLAFSKIVPILPSVIEAAEDEFFTEGKDSDDPAVKGKYLAAKQLEYSEDMLAPVENVSQINKVINEEFRKVLLENKDPQQALNDAEAEINKLLQK